MARIPLAQGPQQLNTGNQTVRTAQLEVAPSGLAQGLQAAGDVGLRVVEMARRADDVKNLTQAGIEMQQAQVEFAKWQQSPEGMDESQWLPKWEETIGKVQTRIGEMPLTPDARAQLTGRFSSWSTQGTITVNAEAFRQKGRNAVQTVQNAIRQGEITGDFTPAYQGVADLEGSGLLPKPEIESLKLSVEGSEMKRAANDYQTQRAEAIRTDDYATVMQLDGMARERNILTQAEYEARKAQAEDGQKLAELRAIAINEDPRKAKEKMASMELPMTDMQNMESLIESEMRSKQIAEMKAIADKIAIGEIKAGKDIQFNFVDSPAEQAKIRAEIDRVPPSPDMLVAEMLDLEQQIDSFDTIAYANRDKETMMKFVNISARVSALPTHVKDEISDKWQGRRNGKLPTTKESYVAEGLNVINSLVKAKEAEFFTGAGTEKKIKKGKEAEFAAFKLRVTKMHNDLKRLMPDNPTVPEALQIINQVTGQDSAEQRMNDYRPIPTQPTGFAPVPRQGLEPALPGGGDAAMDIINPLLPVIPR